MKDRAPFTIGRLIDTYRSESGEPSRREDTRHARWWKERLGDEPVTALTGERIASELDHLASYGRSPSTVAFYLRFLRHVTAWGAICAYLPSDPCAGMALPKERTPEPRVLTEEEERKLCSALGHPYALWVRFAIATGLKQSEQASLRWRDVDLHKGTLLVQHATTGGLALLSLCAETITILQRLRHCQPPSMWVFPDSANPFRPVNFHAFYVGRFVPAVQRAGIPRTDWKALRHTCGVRLAQQGHTVHDIAHFLRHRELKQAYLYRAWRPDQPIPRRGVRLAAPQVFPEGSTEQLQRTLLRDTSMEPVKVGEACELYAVHHLKRRPSREQFDRIYRQHLAWWKDRPLSSLTRREIRAWYAGLSHIPSHANKALTFLRSVFNWALDLELITTGNPSIRIKRYAETSRERFLSVEEAQRFMTQVPDLPAKPRAYLLLLLLTGARKSEARQMRWQDIEEQNRLWRKPRTKNGASHVIPLPAQVYEALQGLPRTSAWVFPGTKGRPWSNGSVDKYWQAIRRRWNMGDVTLHDLRRTCASYLAISGENLPTIQNVLNHRSLNPTSIYARLNTKAVDRALQGQADRLCNLAQDGNPVSIEGPSDPPPDSPPAASVRSSLPVGPITPVAATAAAIPPSAEALASDDPDVTAVMKAAWERLPAEAQAQYVTAAASLGVPLEQLLQEAVEHRLTDLERQYGLSPNGKPAYAPLQMGDSIEGVEA